VLGWMRDRRSTMNQLLLLAVVVSFEARFGDRVPVEMVATIGILFIVCGIDCFF